MRQPPWKIGELAGFTRLSVRALRYYDEIGLLSPSLRSAAGYRMYGAGDVVRLQQIVSLRQLGLPLAQVGEFLRRPDLSPLAIVEAQLARLRQQIDLQQKLHGRLAALAARLRAAETISVAELTQTIQEMNMLDKYFTPDQQTALAERKRQLGDAHIQQVEAEWPRLIAQVRAALDNNADPASEPVQQLARRWMELVREFTGGDPALAASVRTLYTAEPAVATQQGLDPALFAYIQKALAAKPAGNA